jgi:hypothetical protein
MGGRASTYNGNAYIRRNASSKADLQAFQISKKEVTSKLTSICILKLIKISANTHNWGTK